MAAIPPLLLDGIIGRARRTPRVEICGLLGARHGVAVHDYPVANVAPDPARRFTMDPQGQIDAMRTLRERGETLFAIYHSHPAGPAVPSATDLAEAAYPEALYLIISLAADAPVVNAFRLTAGHCVPVALDDPGTPP